MMQGNNTVSKMQGVVGYAVVVSILARSVHQDIVQKMLKRQSSGVKKRIDPAE